MQEPMVYCARCGERIYLWWRWWWHYTLPPFPHFARAPRRL